MVKKVYSKDGRVCRVTFQLPPVVAARTALLFGDFPEARGAAIKMRSLKSGGFAVTVSLPSGRDYRFHYILDGTRWVNDPADALSVPDVFGMEESIVKV